MNKAAIWVLLVLIGVVGLSALVPRGLQASDHADPVDLQEPESNFTDLFFFPDGDRMILILCVRRALTTPGPYNLEPFEYAVHFDLESRVAFESDEDRARYGGTVVDPEGLRPTATIRLRLNDDATLKEQSFEGLRDPERIRVYAGVREDPFNFPRFFDRNTIAMVLAIPMSSFPPGQRDWILWGATYQDGRQIDHVGRSNRTQQARFDSLNTLPPSEHVPEIMRLLGKWNEVFTTLNNFREPQPKALAGLVQYVLQIRKYDLAPDVMIYTDRFPPGFPNGRQLLDDVAALTCQTGDCILQELSFIEGGWPRQTVNDKPFLAEWPYLAEPYPDRPQAAPSQPSIWPWVIGLAVVVALLGWALVEIVRRSVLWLWRRRRRRPALAPT
jgi:hypothetical protein